MKMLRKCQEKFKSVLKNVVSVASYCIMQMNTQYTFFCKFSTTFIKLLMNMKTKPCSSQQLKLFPLYNFATVML